MVQRAIDKKWQNLTKSVQKKVSKSDEKNIKKKIKLGKKL